MRHLIIHPEIKGDTIRKEVYGNFSEHLGRCIYGGVFVGEDSEIPNVNGMRQDVVEALKEMGLPVLRWPGGCFADEYHWKDGVGPKEKRKRMVNTHWGGVTEDNSFGTNEFFELCRQIGCEPYVNGNVGSGTVQEMNEWVEYMTGDGISPMAELRKENGHEEPWKLKYFGVGNENWGCGGNMLPEYYANEFRRYQTYCRNYGDNRLFKIACGPNADDYNWTDRVMAAAGPFMDGLSLHYYTVPGPDWDEKGSSTEFTEDEWYRTLGKAYRMKELVERHAAIMDRYDPEKRIALVVDEWGTWYDVEPGTNPGFLYQQNTMRDALVAALTLNIFNHHADRVRMANIAQLANVLQSVILTEGSEMVKTPTYHVFRMYKKHQGAAALSSSLDTEDIGRDGLILPDLSESASLNADGKIHVTLANTSLDRDTELSVMISGKTVKAVTGEILTGGMNAHNTFAEKDLVAPVSFDSAVLRDGQAVLTVPKGSVISLELTV